MRKRAVRLGVGTKLSYDGELVEIVEMLPTPGGNEVVLRGVSGRRVWRVAVRELLSSEDTRLLPVGQIDETDEGQGESIGVILAELTDQERDEVLERAEHVRELLTGYRSGHAELARPAEPREQYHPRRTLLSRYEAKADELNIGSRTLQRWVQAFRESAEAGLAQSSADSPKRVDPRWLETALEVMVEHTDQSRPSRTAVIDRTNARVTAKFEGVGKMPEPCHRLSCTGRTRAAASNISAEHETQPGHRQSTQRGLRQTSPHSPGRVPLDGHHPSRAQGFSSAYRPHSRSHPPRVRVVGGGLLPVGLLGGGLPPRPPAQPLSA